MSTTRRPRPDRRTGNSPQLPPVGDSTLDRLLAAAVPPHDHPLQQTEFRGEQAAVEAFRETRFQVTASRKRPRRAGAFAAKTVVAVAALSAVGGAVAAATGHLPAGPAGGHGLAPANSSTTPRLSASARSSTGPSVTRGTNGLSAAVPSTALQGLCRAYAAGQGGSSGRALDNPAFSALITAAGGKDKVSSYCGSVLQSSPPATPANSGSPENSRNSQNSGNSQNSENNGKHTGNGGSAHSSDGKSGQNASQDQSTAPATSTPSGLVPSDSSDSAGNSSSGQGTGPGSSRSSATPTASPAGSADPHPMKPASADGTMCDCWPPGYPAGP